MKFVLFFLLVGALGCHAEDFVLADGSVLHDAVVLRRSDEDIQVRHSGGIQRYAYDKLSPELQERFQMTPEQVEARRRQAQEDAAARRREKEEQQAARRALLEASGQHPRYLSGADVLQLYSPFGTLSAREAEFLAAEWNRREALRLGLPVESERFTEEAASLRSGFEEERQMYLKRIQEADALRATVSGLQTRLAQQEAELARLNKANAALQAEWNHKPASTTTVIKEPVYVPTLVPVPQPAPRPSGPRPPAVRPTPRPPVILKPASHARTLPRR